MVFPPYRKPTDRHPRPGQPGSRREPQVDLAELTEQVDHGRLGGSRESYAGGPFGANPPTAADTAQPPATGAPREPRAGSSAATGDDIPTLTQVVHVSPGDPAPPVQTGAGHDEILQRLRRRSDALLEAQLQQALAPAMERMAAIVVRELRESIQGIVHEILDRAIAEELARSQADATENSRLPRRP